MLYTYLMLHQFFNASMDLEFGKQEILLGKEHTHFTLPQRNWSSVKKGKGWFGLDQIYLYIQSWTTRPLWWMRNTYMAQVIFICYCGPTKSCQKLEELAFYKSFLEEPLSGLSLVHLRYVYNIPLLSFIFNESCC